MWFRIINQEVELLIIAKPNAKRTALLSVSDQGLHIALHAKPEEGEANKELIYYLSKRFKIPKSHIKLYRGEHSKRKCVTVPLNQLIQQLLDHPENFTEKY